MKILVIEDNKELSKLISSSINTLYPDKSFEVSVAENGAEGSSKMIITKYDLILLDLHMPVMNGLEFLNHNKEALKKIPVIVITATPDIAKKSIKENVKIIGKPFSINEFSSAINEILFA